MDFLRINKKLTLTQEDVDFILNQPLPSPEVLEQIRAAAEMGDCEGSSYLNVFCLGVKHSALLREEEAKSVE